MKYSVIADLDRKIDSIREEVVTLRRGFHRDPELGFREFRTAARIEEYLEALGYRTNRIAETGVVTVLEGAKDGPTLMLRADMDALPVEEESGADYASGNPGVMHACGHDAHMAILLCAAKILKDYADVIGGRIKFVFQPNEEVSGAIPLIEAGVLETPKVDAAIGLHVWTPLKSGEIGITAGPIFAGMDVFSIEVEGRGGHTGSPEAAVDPVIAAADIITTAQILQTREISPLKPTALVFSRLEAGQANNVIPDKARLSGSLRYLYNGGSESEENPAARFRRIVKSVCETHNCKCRIDMNTENTVLINDSRMAELMRAAAADIVAEDGRIVEHVTMAAEDFSEYAGRVPAAFAFLGAGSSEKGAGYPHHNPRFNIDESVMSSGVELLVRSSLLFFNKDKKEVAGNLRGK